MRKKSYWIPPVWHCGIEPVRGCLNIFQAACIPSRDNKMRKINHRCSYISLDATDKPFNPNAGTPKAKERGSNGKPNPMRPVRPKVTEGYR